MVQVIIMTKRNKTTGSEKMKYHFIMTAIPNDPTLKPVTLGRGETKNAAMKDGKIYAGKIGFDMGKGRGWYTDLQIQYL